MPEDEPARAAGELLGPTAARIRDVHDLEVAQARQGRQMKRGHARARADDPTPCGISILHQVLLKRT